jgi:ABC-2 type transport system permease protein
MRAILDIALNDLRIILSNRAVIIDLLILPIVISLATGLANGASLGGAPAERPRDRVDVIDLDNSTISTAFLQTLAADTPALRLCPLDNDDSDACALESAPLTEARADERLRGSVTRALIVIPAGFGEQVSAGQPAALIYRSNENITTTSYIQEAVNGAAIRVGGAIIAMQTADRIAADLPILQFRDDADRAAFLEGVRTRAEALWRTDPISINYTMLSADETPRPATAAGFSQSVPGIASMYVLITVLPAAASFIRERKQWTMQRMAVMPISRRQILGGKLLARFILGLFQYTLLFGFGYLLGVRYGGNVLALALVMITFVLCATALMIMLTGFLKTEQQAAGITLFISLTLAPLGGAWWPLDIVPEWMRIIGHISPIAWAMDAYRSLMYFGGGVAEVMPSLIVLLAMTGVLFTIGVLRFRFD